jgi:hypothetical protein
MSARLVAAMTMMPVLPWGEVGLRVEGSEVEVWQLGLRYFGLKLGWG